MKLKATDLMIKDWIFSHETQSYQKITSISEENVTINSVTFDYPIYEEIEPIPLTPELLEKCENAIFPIKHLLDCIVCDLSLNYDHTKKTYFKLITCTRYYFNYLHQLQQLIRLLTKQELIINL